MLATSLNIIEDIISTSGRWTWLEISYESIYLEFKDVQLYNPKNNTNKFEDSSSEIAIRLGENIFLAIFFNDINDLNFLDLSDSLQNLMQSDTINFKDNFVSFHKEFSIKINKNQFKFQDRDFLKAMANFYNYKKILVENYAEGNNGYDFLLCFTAGNISIAVGGNNIHFFNDFENLTDEDIKNLSNKWCIYYLKYWINKGTNKEYPLDYVCESLPLKLK
jgi:hypothetical protein